MNTDTKQFYEDFDIFSRALIASKDVDPTYPFINRLIFEYSFDPEWFAIAYVNFYSLASAIIFCNEFPSRDDFNKQKFIQMRNDKVISHMGVERRGTQRNLENQVIMFEKSIIALKKRKFDFSNQTAFRKSTMQNLHLYGVWASFKLSEVFEKSLNYGDLRIQDLGIQGKDPNSNDGPIGGLRWLFGRKDHYDNSHIALWDKLGIKLRDAWKVDLGEVETCLCKWHKICSGNYYIGHDIDEFWELRFVMTEEVFFNCMSIFDSSFLTPRHGVDKNKKKLFLQHGLLFNRHFESVNKNKADVIQIIMDL